MKSERLFKALGQIDSDLVEEAENDTLRRKPVHLLIKFTPIAACFVLAVLVFIVNSQTGLFSQIYNSVNGNNISNPTTSESHQNTNNQYDKLYGKIGANNNSGSSSSNISAKGGVMIQQIDLSPLGISGYADTSQSTTFGTNLFVLVSGSDNSGLHLAVVNSDKTKLFAYVDCTDILQKLLKAPDTQSALSSVKIGSVRSFDNHLVLNFFYDNSDVQKTLMVVYDITNPANPVLTGAFGQSGAYTSYKVNANVITLFTEYTALQPDKNDLNSYVPYTTDSGTDSFVPIECIYSGAGTADQYSVVSQWNISGALSLMNSYAFLGKNISDAYIFGHEIMVPETTETTTQVDKTYGPWQDVPNDLITAETGTKLRYASTISVIARSTVLLLYSVNNGDLSLTSTATLPGSFLSDEDCINQYNGNFRVILCTSTDAESGGSYENADGKEVVLNNSFLQEGFTHIPSPPDLSKYVKNGFALYIFDGNLRQIGTIPDITPQWISSISFNGTTANLYTQNTEITLDLSDPSAPKIR